MADRTLPHGLIAFGPQANCTLELCPVEASLLGYLPSVPANAIFIAIFGISLFIQAWQGWQFKRWWGYAVSMICGCILEMVGYGGRVKLHGNPFDFSGFLAQIVCITIAPVFYCAGIYVLLSRVIHYTDPSMSRFKPSLFYWIFIPSDILSLVLQASGGALSVTGGTLKAINNGEHIWLAGLVFQVFTLFVFSCLFIDYIYRWSRSPVAYRLNKSMRRFLGLLFLATVFIFIRCAYRIAELQKGYFSSIFRDQGLFIGLESVVMCIAALLLNIGHPGYTFDEDVAPPPSIPVEEQKDSHSAPISTSDS